MQVDITAQQPVTTKGQQKRAQQIRRNPQQEFCWLRKMEIRPYNPLYSFNDYSSAEQCIFTKILKRHSRLGFPFKSNKKNSGSRYLLEGISFIQ